MYTKLTLILCLSIFVNGTRLTTKCTCIVFFNSSAMDIVHIRIYNLCIPQYNHITFYMYATLTLILCLSIFGNRNPAYHPIYLYCVCFFFKLYMYTILTLILCSSMFGNRNPAYHLIYLYRVCFF